MYIGTYFNILSLLYSWIGEWGPGRRMENRDFGAGRSVETLSNVLIPNFFIIISSLFVMNPQKFTNSHLIRSRD